MAKKAVLEDRIENRLDGMEARLSRLDGTVEQMDRRLSGLEQGQRQYRSVWNGDCARSWPGRNRAVAG